jgi:hypothetical protein
MRDAPVAERVQVSERQANSVCMVRADVRGTPSAPDVDSDQRHLARSELSDQPIVGVHPDENCRVDAVIEADVVRRQ